MKWLKKFEDFKLNNREGGLITIDDIIKCIQSNGVIYTDIVKDYQKNEADESIKPVSIDDDGVITVEIDGSEYEVDLKDVKKIEF
jgi:hypothetical protein